MIVCTKTVRTKRIFDLLKRCVSRDPDRMILNYIHVDVDLSGVVRLVATDARKMLVSTLDDDLAKTIFGDDRKTANVRVEAMSKDYIMLSEDDGKNSGGKMYPNWRAAVPTLDSMVCIAQRCNMDLVPSIAGFVGSCIANSILDGFQREVAEQVFVNRDEPAERPIMLRMEDGLELYVMVCRGQFSQDAVMATIKASKGGAE